MLRKILSKRVEKTQTLLHHRRLVQYIYIYIYNHTYTQRCHNLQLCAPRVTILRSPYLPLPTLPFYTDIIFSAYSNNFYPKLYSHITAPFWNNRFYFTLSPLFTSISWTLYKFMCQIINKIYLALHIYHLCILNFS